MYDKQRKFFGIVLSDSFAIFLKNYRGFLTVFSVFLLPLLAVRLFIWDRTYFLYKTAEKSEAVFQLLNIGPLLVLVALFVLCCMATIVAAAWADRHKSLNVFAIYWVAIKAFPAVFWVKLLYLSRIIYKLFCLVVPGIFALTDGSVASVACLVDGKRGMEAVSYSEDLVKSNRNPYLDSLFLGLVWLVCWAGAIVLALKSFGFFAQEFVSAEAARWVVFFSFFVLFNSLMYFLIFYCRAYIELKEQKK